MKIRPSQILNILFPLLLLFLVIDVYILYPEVLARLWSKTSDAHYEEKRMMDPVYRFIKQAKEHISENESVYFYDKWVNGHKARYYLYPVRYIFMPPDLKTSEVLEKIDDSDPDFVICNVKNNVPESQGWTYIFGAENWRLYRVSNNGHENI